MLKGLIGIVLFFVGIFAWAANWEAAPETRIRIGVLDTGLDLKFNPKIQPFVCRGGHTSIVDQNPFSDSHNNLHGTNVAGLITENLDPKTCSRMILFIRTSRPNWS